jgi:hypothetical protein
MSANAQYCLGCISGGAVYMSMTREPPKILVNQSTTTTTGLTVLAPNIGASNNIGIILGQAVSSNNYATIGFQYVGAGSTNNYLYLGATTSTTLCITAAGQVGIGITNPSELIHLYNSGANANMGIITQNGTRQWRAGVRGDVSSVYAIQDDTAAQIRLIINSSGQVGIGTVSPDNFFHVYGSAITAMRVTTTTESDMMLMYGNIGGSSSTGVYVMPIRVGSTSTLVGGIQWSGSNLLYNNSSDYRLKENIVPMQHGLLRIMSLNPVTYNWIEHKTVGEGFIAHEVQSVIPMAVSGEKDAVHADGSIIPQGLDYSKIVVHLVSGMQEQQQLITALQTQVQQLQQRLG